MSADCSGALLVAWLPASLGREAPIRLVEEPRAGQNLLLMPLRDFLELKKGKGAIHTLCVGILGCEHSLRVFTNFAENKKQVRQDSAFSPDAKASSILAFSLATASSR